MAFLSMKRTIILAPNTFYVLSEFSTQSALSEMNTMLYLKKFLSFFPILKEFYFESVKEKVQSG